LRSGAFSVTKGKDGQPPAWKTWQATTKTVEEPSGARTIYTQVLSTTGVPVGIAIPLKPMAEVSRIPLQEVLNDYRKSQHSPSAGRTPVESETTDNRQIRDAD
jgi:hypothetical protein